MFRTIHFDSIDSTNDYLMKNGKDLPHLTIVTSKIQTKGRGRMGRHWLNSKNALLFSILIKKKFNLDDLFLLNYLAPVALSIFLSKLVSNIKIKFPNDIIIENKKLSGILVESSISENRFKYGVLGYGINIDDSPILKKEGIKPTFLRKYIKTIPESDEITNSVRENIDYFLNLENRNDKIISLYNKFLADNIKYKFKFPNGDSSYLKIKKINSHGNIVVYGDDSREFILPASSTYLSDCEVIE